MPTFFDKLFKSKADSSAAAATLGSFDALFAQGTAAAAAGDLPRAITLYDQAIVANPARAESYYKRANALKDLGRLQEALTCYNQAIERKADYAHAFCNRAFVQQSLGLAGEALASYDQAIAADPNDALAHNNRALLLQLMYRWDEALAGYDRAIAINPGYADAHYNRSLTALFLGDFSSGWPDFEWRRQVARRINISPPREFGRPLWLGNEPIAGKRLLVYSEEGLGDALQFCRYVTLAAARGATVVVEVQAPLVNLMKTLAGASQVIARGDPLPPFDYHCPLMSLPLAFRTTVASIPSQKRYLHPSAEKVAAWRSTPGGESTTPRIGLVWSGNPNNAIDSRRSLALTQWIPRLPGGYDYFRLQNEVRPADQAALDSHRLIASPGDLAGFENTAAFCECLDLLISVDTSIAHLGGALGLPTWVLLPFVPDWRWMRDREDTPWYPNMKLYRQQRPDDWDEVLDRVADDLQREFPR